MSKAEICLGELRALGGVTDEQAQEIVARIEKYRAMVNVERGDDLLRYAMEQGDAAKFNAALDRQRIAKRVLARRDIETRYKGFVDAGLRPDQAIMAMLEGTNWGIAGARDSVSSLRLALEAQSIGPLKKFFKERPEIEKMLLSARAQFSAKGRAARNAFYDDVVREMDALRPDGRPGLTKNKGARELAEHLAGMTEDMRSRLNLEGAGIGKIQGWVPHSHDAIKLLDAGFAKWSEIIKPLLDLEATFPHLFDPGFTPAGELSKLPVEQARAVTIDRYLSEVYDNIALNRRTQTAARQGEYTGPGNQLSRWARERVLHFRGADEWIEYHKSFGKGNILEATVEQTMREARTLALVQRMGSNPETMIKSFIAEQADNIGRDLNLDDKTKRQWLDKLNEDWGRRNGKMSQSYAEIAGETMMPHDVNAARVSSAVRAWVSMAKLGSATLSAFPDIANTMLNLRHNGMSWGEVLRDGFIGGLLSGRTKKHQREATYLFDAFLDGMMGSFSARFDSGDAFGKFSSLQSFFHRLNFLTQWTDSLKSGVSRLHSAHLAMLSSKSFDTLPTDLQRVLTQHNLHGDRWELLRPAVDTLADGKAYMTPEAVRALPLEHFTPLVEKDLEGVRQTIQGKRPAWTPAMEEKFQAQRERALSGARSELEVGLLRYYADEGRYAVIEATDATRRRMYHGSQPGTLAGEVWRFVMQFKSFPIAHTERILGRMSRLRRTPDQGALAGVFGQMDNLRDISFMIAATSALGYASMTAKDFLRGQEPRPVSAKTWAAAMLQGGGAGIYGDFLFGQANRFGASPAETIVGPFISGLATDVLGAGMDALQYVTGQSDKFSAAKQVRKVVNNLPFVNLWYTRTALDYGILYHVQEHLDPGSLARNEARIRRERDQEYWLPPSRYAR